MDGVEGRNCIKFRLINGFSWSLRSPRLIGEPFPIGFFPLVRCKGSALSLGASMGGAVITVFEVLWAPMAGMRRARSASSIETWATGVALVSAYVILQLAYFSLVDADVVKAAFLDGLQPDQQAAASKMMGIGMLFWVAAVTGAVSMFVGWIVLAAYMFLMAKVRTEHARFGEGLKVAVFASAPNLLLLPLGLVSIVVAGPNGIDPGELNPTSLNQLITRFEPSHPAYGLLETLSLTAAWSVALTCVGVRSWFAKSMKSAVAIGALPALVTTVVWIGVIAATAP